MPGWVWTVIGLALLSLELGLIDTGFYLVFLGASAVVVGLSVMFVGPASVSLQWLLYGAISVVSLLGFRRKVYASIRSRTAPDLPEGTTGEWALANERIEPGAVGRVELRAAPGRRATSDRARSSEACARRSCAPRACCC